MLALVTVKHTFFAPFELTSGAMGNASVNPALFLIMKFIRRQTRTFHCQTEIEVI